MTTFTDAIKIIWKESTEKVDYYQIRYKSKDVQDKWKVAVTNTDCNQALITGLKANTRYTFQVRAIFQDREGIYGPANDDLKTMESSASRLLKYSVKVANGNPEKYMLQAQEKKKSRNNVARTKKLIFGKILQ